MHSFYENIIHKALQRRLIDPNDMVSHFQQKTKLLLFFLIFLFQGDTAFRVAGMKVALDLSVYYGGPNPSPMLRASTETRQVIKKAFVDNEFVPQSR